MRESCATSSRHCSMHMPMMNVRVVRMPVSQHLVRMGMDMRVFAAPFSAMAMLMVLIMSVAVRMHDRLMRVLMLMTLSQVKPNADAHEHCRRPEQRRSEEHTSELQSPCNLVCRL